jgi:hypothetical protein
MKMKVKNQKFDKKTNVVGLEDFLLTATASDVVSKILHEKK